MYYFLNGFPCQSDDYLTDSTRERLYTLYNESRNVDFDPKCTAEFVAPLLEGCGSLHGSASQEVSHIWHYTQIYIQYAIKMQMHEHPRVLDWRKAASPWTNTHRVRHLINIKEAKYRIIIQGVWDTRQPDERFLDMMFIGVYMNQTLDAQCEDTPSEIDPCSFCSI